MRVDPNYLLNLTGALNASGLQEQTLTNELSSGLRVGSLADDPVAVSTNTGFNSSLSRLDSFVQSAGGVESRLQVTDSTLGQVVSQVTSAISLAVSAGNGTLNAANLQAIGKQITDIRNSVVSLANTSYSGSYLFSGSQGGTAPFSIDSTTTPATVNYSGDDVTQKLATPDGAQLQVSLPGSAVFNAAGSSLLGALNQLVADVNSGVTTNLTADSTTLTTALGGLSTQRSALGSSLSRLTDSSTYAQTQATQVQAAQSTLLAADPATVATDLKSAETQNQALLAIDSSLNQTGNLFSYLK